MSYFLEQAFRDAVQTLAPRDQEALRLAIQQHLAQTGPATTPAAPKKIDMSQYRSESVKAKVGKASSPESAQGHSEGDT